ncbi:hypothetical protein NDU88_004789 [Pleurodeles waltl]|uniref:Retroviral integrase C-terminal SH3 domain-containing protein n=1 Tax=Pleurodeles waltl TaxID=8319 RepID=A0AAV7VJS7_PLEWA|nr:hypothetical protein NDU88_004789 [Pleurodeles waltl]
MRLRFSIRTRALFSPQGHSGTPWFRRGAASTGIKDVPVTPTGWIPRAGALVREKVTVKKEFGPSYRTQVPVLGLHGTRTVILPPLAGAKENRFVSIDNVKPHHVADPAQQTKRNIQ